MKVGVAAALLVAALASGCAEQANPHLLAPKLVVEALDDGNVTLFVHGAFQERLYDRILLAIDNDTIEERADAFSLETRVPSDGFFVEVRAWAADQEYGARARIDVDRDEARARIATLDDEGAWSPAETFALPHGRVIEKVSP